MSFANLKKSSNLDKLKKAVEAMSQNSYEQDSANYWKPEVDKAGNGYAVIRFLPAPPQDGEDGLPWVKVFHHGFQGPGGWYIENSLTTLGEADPVSELNTELWNSGIESNKDIARKQKRKLNYISNILVVDDPKNPDNNGKVFKYKYVKTIFEKIKSAMDPEFEDETPINPFDFWTGANFKLKIRKYGGYQNYDKSEFDKPTPIASSDAEIEEIWKKEFSLKEELDRKHFKTYDQLKSRLDRVLGNHNKNTKAMKEIADQEEAIDREIGNNNTNLETTVEDIDDDLAYFRELASD